MADPFSGGDPFGGVAPPAPYPQAGAPQAAPPVMDPNMGQQPPMGQQPMGQQQPPMGQQPMGQQQPPMGQQPMGQQQPPMGQQPMYQQPPAGQQPPMGGAPPQQFGQPQQFGGQQQPQQFGDPQFAAQQPPGTDQQDVPDFFSGGGTTEPAAPDAQAAFGGGAPQPQFGGPAQPDQQLGGAQQPQFGAHQPPPQPQFGGGAPPPGGGFGHTSFAPSSQPYVQLHIDPDDLAQSAAADAAQDGSSSHATPRGGRTVAGSMTRAQEADQVGRTGLYVQTLHGGGVPLTREFKQVRPELAHKYGIELQQGAPAAMGGRKEQGGFLSAHFRKPITEAGLDGVAPSGGGQPGAPQPGGQGAYYSAGGGPNLAAQDRDSITQFLALRPSTATLRALTLDFDAHDLNLHRPRDKDIFDLCVQSEITQEGMA